MGAIEEELNKYLNATEDDLKVVIDLLNSKGFFENDNSLRMLFQLLEIAYKQGYIQHAKESRELLELLQTGKKEFINEK